MQNLTKEERIKAEINRISKFFDEVDANQRAIVTPLLQNASFMRATLEDLQEIIIAEGVTETYQNGLNQYGKKQSAALQSYINLTKIYASVIKQLSSLLPPEKKTIMSGLYEWNPPEKTEEEREEEERRQIERQQRINEEIARAAEIQRQQREKEKAEA